MKIISGNKKIILISAIILVVLVILITVKINLASKSNEPKSDNSVVATVNNEPIMFNEFQQFLGQNISQTYSYFHNKYGAEDSVDFWTTSFGGESTIEYARAKTMEQLVRIKIVQSLAKQNGLIQNISYNNFLKELEKENLRRQEALKNNTVIYGPKQYDEINYFNYIFSNMQIALQKKLSEKELFLDEGKLKAYYEENKDKKYKNDDTLKIQRILINYSLESNSAYAQKKADEIRANIISGAEPSKIFDLFKDDLIIKVSSDEVLLDAQSRRNERGGESELTDAMNAMTKGEVSKVLNQPNSFIILKCLDRKDEGYQLYENIKDAVKANIVEGNYKYFIDGKVKAAKVNINQDVLVKIKAR